MSNKFYDILKWVATVALPAIAALYSGLAEVWNLPYAEQIPKTVLLIVAFLGAVLGVSSIKYAKNQNSTEAIDGTIESASTDETTEI